MHGILHRDLKPENILMTDTSDDADVRIIDFCISRRIDVDEKVNDRLGTIGYMAPEVLLGQNYSFSADVWSIGIIAYLLLTGYLPFDDEEDKEIIKKTLNEDVFFDKKKWNELSTEAMNFIKKILNKDMNKRINIENILTDPWIELYAGKKEKF